MIAMSRKRSGKGGDSAGRGEGKERTGSVKTVPAAAAPPVIWNQWYGRVRDAVLYDRFIQILLVFTCIGAVLRIFQIGFNPLWLDEAMTNHFANLSYGEYWQTVTSGADFNPPVFVWMVHTLISLFGNSEAVLRAIPCLFGILSIPLIYFAGSLLSDRRTGLVAAGFLAFSTYHLMYSQEARAYAPLVFAVLLQMVFILKGARENRTMWWLCFGLATAFSCWIHFYGFLATAVLVVLLPLLEPRFLSCNKSVFIPFLRGIVPGVILLLPLVAVTIWLSMIRVSTPLTYGIQGLSVLYYSLLHFTNSDILYLCVLLALALVGGIFIYIENRRHAIWLLLLFLLVFGVSIALSYKIPMESRYLIIALPALYIAAGASWKFFARFIPAGAAVAVLIAIAVLLNAMPMAIIYTQPQKEDYRALAKDLSAATRDGDYVLTMPSYISYPLEYYYKNTTDETILRRASLYPQLEEVNRERGSASLFIVVTTDIFATEPDGKSLAWLNQNAQRFREYPGGTGGMLLLKVRETGGK